MEGINSEDSVKLRLMGESVGFVWNKEGVQREVLGRFDRVMFFLFVIKIVSLNSRGVRR